jgi:hypothetical protein
VTASWLPPACYDEPLRRRVAPERQRDLWYIGEPALSYAQPELRGIAISHHILAN